MSFLQPIANPSGTKLLDTGNTNSLLDTAPSTTTLAVALTNTTGTTVVLTSGTGVAAGRQINIGTERMRITDDSAAPTYIVTRGYGGSTAATHLISATVNVPGKVVYQLLSIALAPNVELFVRKSSADINFIAVTTASPNTFPGGGTVIELTDNNANGTGHFKFPALGNEVLILASGGAMAGPAGPAGAPGGSAIPPGNFTIGTVTAEWVTILAS